jgi:signal transduction histidine kinase
MNNYPSTTALEASLMNHSTASNVQAEKVSSKRLLKNELSRTERVAYENFIFWDNEHALDAVNLKIRMNELLINSMVERRKAEVVQSAKAVEEAVAAERNRLARDLHDAVTQTLFSASLIAEVLPELWNMDETEGRKSTEELRQLTRGALAEMRTLLLELRPAALTEARFIDLVKQLSEAVTGRARLPIHLDINGDCEMPPDVKVTFYRIAQESLNNVIKYAHASQVEITIRLESGKAHMEIRDNGVGFDPNSIKPTSLGMRIMRERAEAVHAQVGIGSEPGQGTKISLDWSEV